MYIEIIIKGEDTDAGVKAFLAALAPLAPASVGSVLSDVVAPAAVPAVSAPPVAVTARSATPEVSTSVFTEEDVANATRALATSKGIDIATSLLKEFEIEKARDLPVEKREAYIARAKALQATT